jgi:asparagine synthase (glutamine-hydrolysing)
VSGFFGIVREDGASVDERLLHDVCERMRFRGPDGVSIWREDGVGSCFALMRTGPAPQAERQPVETAGRFRLFGDIRLDAREELQRQLADKGYVGNLGVSSEELFLCAWQAWGETALEKVIGDFSLALWNGEEHALYCARDFVGPRPFYYAQVGGVFCFSNTLDVLRCVPEVSDELDEAYIGDFLLEGWSADPASTVYRDIRRLPPGHLLNFANGRTSVRRFLKLAIEEPVRFKRPEDYVEGYLDVVRAATKDRLPKGKTALYLSGGLDSGSICALTAQLAGAHPNGPLKAFTTSWKPLLTDPEPEIAELTARHLGIAHRIFEEKEFRAFEQPASGDGRTPEPLLDPFFARQQRQYREIAAHSNVILGGDGGDEVLSGQAWPYLVYLSKSGQWGALLRDFGGYFLKYKKMPPLRAGIRANFARLAGREKPFEHYPQWLNPDFEGRTNLRERWLALRNHHEVSEHPMHPRAYAGLHRGYWGNLQQIEDAGWTGVNLESLAPLLDLRVLHYLLRLPPVPWCANKELCRVAMKGLLPDEVTERPKTPMIANPNELEAGEKEKWNIVLPAAAPEICKQFVNWQKWSATFRNSKGSLSWTEIRPLSLFKWFESR